MTVKFPLLLTIALFSTLLLLRPSSHSVVVAASFILSTENTSSSSSASSSSNNRPTLRSRIEDATTTRVVAMYLVQATTGATVATLTNGTIIYWNDYTNHDFTIVAVSNRRIGGGQVRFTWDNPINRGPLAIQRTERKSPYTLCGGTYSACPHLGPGLHTVTARMGRNRLLRPAPRYTVQFEIANRSDNSNSTTTLAPVVATAPTSRSGSLAPAAVPTPAGTVPTIPTTTASPSSTNVPTSIRLVPTPALQPNAAAPLAPTRTVPTPTVRTNATKTQSPMVVAVPSSATAPVPTMVGPTALAPIFAAPKAPSARTAAPVLVPSAPMRLAPMMAPVLPPTRIIVAPVAPAPAPFDPILINCGGATAYTDTLGRKWRADDYFTGGFVYDTDLAISGTVDDSLYNCERYGATTYSIPLPMAGTYTVVLHFSEIFHAAAGKRVFDVNVEGRLIDDIDLVKMGGGVALKVVTQTLSAVVNDGLLTIRLLENVPLVDNPKISAIAVYKGTSTTPPTMAKPPVVAPPVAVRPPTPARVPTRAPVAVVPVPIPIRPPVKAPMLLRPPTRAPALVPNKLFAPVLINCGGAAYKDTLGRQWRADEFFLGGEAFAVGTAIAGTSDDPLYQAERFGPSTYSIPVPAGTYTVVLHLCEIYHNAIGQRVFDLDVEGQQLAGVDVVQLAGGVAFKAVTRVVKGVKVLDGFLTIKLLNKIDLAKISAIEVNDAQTLLPTVAPAKVPTAAPVRPPVTDIPFAPILISCGGAEYTDDQGRVWMADKHYEGGYTFFNGVAIYGTTDDFIYQGERFGTFKYEIPVPNGLDLEVILHFSETFFNQPRSRVFDVIVEGKWIRDVDIIQQAGGRANFAIQREAATVIQDGFLSIQFLPKNPAIGDPKVSGIEVRKISTHFAHAVAAGPYIAVDADDNGSELVKVDASQSHTHGPGKTLTSFVWKLGKVVLGNGMMASLPLPVGTHDVTLTVKDSSGDVNSDVTTITVRKAGYPMAKALFPNSGDVSRGGKVIITGSALSFVTEVRFGLVVLTGSAVAVLNATALSVTVPEIGFGVPVAVTVTTPVGVSNPVAYQYINSEPVTFAVDKLLDFATPSAVAFGPDGNLYVGNTKGQLGRFTLNDNYDAAVTSVISTIGDGTRGIHGIAFDPMETAELGTKLNVYISTSKIFHIESRNSFGLAINGKIQTVKGANLDIVTDVVTGLPVSELDHSVNGITFGDNGELYIAVGSNTNGGIPGELSTSRIMRENFFSAAVLVANMGQPGFDGNIKYSSQIDGDPISGFGNKGVDIFASGFRNPFGLWYHSNGNLYGTENGPNPGFGDMQTGCEPGQQIPDAYEMDELNLIKRGGYYGHPNSKRAEKDPRQCVWRAASLPSDGKGYTGPMMKLASSTDGIIEFESDHFKGQMRGDLILSKYTDGLFRVILNADGTSVNPNSDPAIALNAGDNGLAVTQAPDGSLVDARHDTNSCYFFKPVETPSLTLDIKAVFPRRGSLAGGTKLSIFGVNFARTTAPVSVSIGGKACTNVVVVSTRKMECTLPMHTVVGKKDVMVTVGGQTDTFVKGYRYITGKPLVLAA